MDMNQIAVEIAYSDGFDAGKQAAVERILFYHQCTDDTGF